MTPLQSPNLKRLRWLPILGLLLAAAVILGVFVWRGNRSPDHPDPSASAADPTTAPAPASRSGQSKATAHPRPLHQERLDQAARDRLISDPAAAMAADPDDFNLLTAWAALDPQAALRWVIDHDAKSAHTLGAIAAGILIRDGADAMRRFIAEHDEDSAISPKNQGRLMEYAFFTLGRADSIQPALRLLQESDDAATQAGMMVLGVRGAENQIRAIDFLKTKGVEVGVDYWGFQATIDEDPRYWADWAVRRDSEMVTDILQAWHRQNPAEALIWLNDRIPPSDPRRAVIDERLKP